MDWSNYHQIFIFVQKGIAFLGMLIILSGILRALFEYGAYLFTRNIKQDSYVNTIRLKLGRILTLGLEFIVAADVIGTTTAPDYYTVGILAIIVIIRTILNYSLNKEIMDLTKEQEQIPQIAQNKS